MAGKATSGPLGGQTPQANGQVTNYGPLGSSTPMVNNQIQQPGQQPGQQAGQPPAQQQPNLFAGLQTFNANAAGAPQAPAPQAPAPQAQLPGGYQAPSTYGDYRNGNYGGGYNPGQDFKDWSAAQPQRPQPGGDYTTPITLGHMPITATPGQDVPNPFPQYPTDWPRRSQPGGDYTTPSTLGQMPIGVPVGDIGSTHPLPDGKGNYPTRFPPNNYTTRPIEYTTLPTPPLPDGKGNYPTNPVDDSRPMPRPNPDMPIFMPEPDYQNPDYTTRPTPGQMPSQAMGPYAAYKNRSGRSGRRAGRNRANFDNYGGGMWKSMAGALRG